MTTLKNGLQPRESRKMRKPVGSTVTALLRQVLWESLDDFISNTRIVSVKIDASLALDKRPPAAGVKPSAPNPEFRAPNREVL